MKVKCADCEKEWNSNAKQENVLTGKITCKCGGLACLVVEPTDEAGEDLQAELELWIGKPKSIERTLKLNELRKSLCTQS